MKKKNRILKLMAAMLLAGSLSLNAQNVSFNNERVTLKQAFEKIESVSNYKIAYNSSQIDVNKQVVLNQKNERSAEGHRLLLRSEGSANCHCSQEGTGAGKHDFCDWNRSR